MNRILLGVIAVFVWTSVFAGKVAVTKGDVRTLKPTFNTLEFFRKIPLAEDRVSPQRATKESRRVIALRVEFAEDDDERTTGNGKMDYEGNGEEPIDTIIEGDTLLNPYYDGPHTKRYFEMLLQCLKNFYLVNSYGNLNIEYRVFPDGDSAAYKLPHTMVYYGNPDERELGLCTLLRDALVVAEEQDSTFELRRWLNTSDDLLIFHAGSAWQTDIMWDTPYDIAAAHIPRGALLYYLGDDSYLPYGFVGGTVLPEMARQDGVMFGLEGELVHEYAHNLGAFDLYDVTGWSMGVGAWDLMGYGGWLGDPVLPSGRVPSMHSAFFKYLMEWVDPLVVENDTTVTMDAAEVDTSDLDEVESKTFVVKVPINDVEYFLIENRQEFAHSETLYADMEMGVIVYVEGGQWDYFLPGSGLLVWHIDEGVIVENWAYNTVNALPSRKGVDLEEADGIQDFDGWVEGSSYEIYGSPYDPFFAPYNDSFAPRTNPNTADNDGGATGIHLVDISESGMEMSLTVLRGGDEKFRPKAGFPLSLEDSSGFGTNSVNIWERGGDHRVVVLGRGGDLHIVDGDSVTTYATGDSMFSSPVISGDSVMCMARNGRLHTWSDDTATVLRVGQGPFYSSPAAGDIDGDGVAEVIVGSDRMWLYFIDDRTVADSAFMGDIVRTSPAIVDLDGAGADEVIVSSGDSRIFVFDGDGDIWSGYPVGTEILGPLRASPVVGDIDSDGELEMLSLSMDGSILCFDEEGGLEQYWPSPIGEPGFSSPVLGDIDRDGFLEVVVICEATLHAVNHNGSVCTEFPVGLEAPTPLPTFWFGEDSLGASGGFEEPFSSPIIVDFEGDGYLEILFASGTNVYGYNHEGEELDGFPLGCGGEVSSTPAAVVRGDTLFLYVVSDEGRLYCWKAAGDPALVWPMFRGDATHSGAYLASLGHSPIVGSALLRDVYNYPNPVYGNKTALRYFLSTEDTNVKVTIFDVAGDIVGEYEGNATPQEYNEITLDLAGLASGLYIYRVEAENSSRSEVFMGKLAVVR